ncbi:OmpA family protein [Mesorhizobium sp. A556]
MALTETAIFLALGAVLLSASAALAADVAGSADHPLLPRYEGSEIVSYTAEKFTDYRLLNARAKNYGGLDKNLDATLPLEGKVMRISYRAPADRSVLEVFRNYENTLKAAGFEAVFTCETDACGGRNFNHAIATGKLYSLFGEYQAEQRYLATKQSRPEGDVYAAIYAVMNKAGGGANANRAMVQLDIVELKPMEAKMVVLDASALQSEIATEGRVAVYGILFDFDKADIRPDSEPQLQEIAALLKDSPDLEVLIVGHTDAKGAFDYNHDLSLRRAKAVVGALLSGYELDADRLTAVGVGMAAPVATNRTEEGRTKNRRVEIVER